MNSAELVPGWLQYGAFGLLCAVLLGCAWFLRWLVQAFFGGEHGLLRSVQRLADTVEHVRARLDSIDDAVDSIEDALERLQRGERR